jgi:hypothetical protein
VKDFSRSRKLDIQNLVGFLIYSAATSNENGLSINSQNFFRSFFQIAPANKQSISEARQKISWQAFEYLLTEIYGESPQKPYWKGHKVRVIDGTTITLPRTEEILKKFEPAANQNGNAHYPKCLLVLLMDLNTGQPITVALGNTRDSERNLALKTMEKLNPNDLLLLDRGLGGSNMYREMNKRNLLFIHRTNTHEKKAAKYVREFILSKKKEDIVTVNCNPSPLLLRLVRGPTRKNGQAMVLVTNLLDKEHYRRKDVLGLYKKRWDVELLFNNLKNTLSIESIRSKSINNVLQDIYSNLIAASITALLEFLGSSKYGMDRERARCSFKNTLNVLRRHFLTLVGSIRLTRKSIDSILDEIIIVIWRKQPGRSYPRYSRQPRKLWTAPALRTVHSP